MSVLTLQKKSSASAKKRELISGEQLLEMGDIGPRELIEGEITPISPTQMLHGRLVSQLTRILAAYAEAHDLGVVMAGEVGVYIRRNPDTIRAADLLYISRDRLAEASPQGFLDVAPELVVEITSPSDRWGDVRRKLRDYFEAGVTAVLVVEPDETLISLFRSPTELQELGGADILELPDILPGFKTAVAELLTLNT
jgi:Uma2 family endonuclease